MGDYLSPTMEIIWNEITWKYYVVLSDVMNFLRDIGVVS